MIAGLDSVQDDALVYLRQQNVKRKLWTGDNLKSIGHRTAYAMRLVWREKEILVFAALQWVVIGLAYYV